MIFAEKNIYIKKEILELKNVNYFFASLTMIDLGHWVHNYYELKTILTFLLAFSRWQIHQTLMKV